MKKKPSCQKSTNLIPKRCNMEPIFEVLGTDSRKFEFKTINHTLHFDKERTDRHLRIVETLGDGNLICSFVVDKGHWNGAEVHSIFSNGVIIIRNQRTDLLITELIARPGQLRRYYEKQGLAIPAEIYPIMEKARAHQIKGYNNW